MSKCEICKKEKKTYTTILAFEPYGSRCLELCEECAVKMAEKTRELFEELTKENDEKKKITYCDVSKFGAE